MLQGLNPEVVPSTFDEDLPHAQFEDVHEYPVATATYKAVEVYQRLVVSMLWDLRVDMGPHGRSHRLLSQMMHRTW